MREYRTFFFLQDFLFVLGKLQLCKEDGNGKVLVLEKSVCVKTNSSVFYIQKYSYIFLCMVDIQG